MRVVLLPSNLDGSGQYRMLLPARELRDQLGWETVWAPHGKGVDAAGHVHLTYGAKTRAGTDVGVAEVLLAWEFDVLLMQQRSEPGWGDVIRGLRAQGKRVLVDSDDAWFQLPRWNPGWQKRPGDVAAMIEQVSAADGLSVATPALAAMYEQFQPNVRVIRNRLDWRMWEDVQPVYEQDRRRVRVGWMGDARWRAGDIDVLGPWLGPWLEAHPEVEFCVAGDTTGLTHDHLGVPHGQRVSTAAVEFHSMELADITATFDIGLVPLKVDDPRSRLLNECKSHLKGMEYAACGIPCVASDTESYRWWVDRYRGHALLADSPERWVASLERMLGEWRYAGLMARQAAQLNTLQQHIGEREAWIAGSHLDLEPPRSRAPVAAGVG